MCRRALKGTHKQKPETVVCKKKKKSWNQHVTNSNRNFANLMEVEI
jgi:hypothetical protein